ncbi:c-type cytochrome biogenesis protein CcmI (plasmid) [Rhizobium sp. CB3090]|uniref:c-type cytochrome biogenesis protein CcmI n=1 Tax=Rhizobium sp. CB3090 TaxID=3039156 RepID=UPI0024B22965|nr:c-type cytochrome biogenesis protein CcmI [Rhizobium sp. CB3090]WFU13393.1 c-type cytochrome biogenesis protein CcmI [Rhizobium sp. CB3090]
MMIWILFAVVTTATTAALLHPLSSGRIPSMAVSVDATAVYRDQLQELEREFGLGRISANEYEITKAETARRLLKAAERDRAEAPTTARSHRWWKLIVVVFLPLVSVGIYTALGSPELPSKPLEERLRNPGEDTPILVRKIEDHLRLFPDDGKGWDVVAPVYLEMGRVDQAETAYRNVIRILGPNVARLDGLSETTMALAGGKVTAETRTILAQILQLEPNNPRALFYLALALEQDGKTAEAKTAFEALAQQSPPDAPWMVAVNDHIAKNGGAAAMAAAGSANTNAPGNPTSEQVAAADAMNAGDRQQMIRGMVASLDAKLREDPKNFEGWMRLIRSYAVLNDKDRAAAALKRGLQSFPADGDEGKQLLSLAKELGLPTEVTQQ